MSSNPNNETNQSSNPELEEIFTHQAGATDLHRTRISSHVVSIDPPIGTGIVDERETHE